VGESPVFLF